MGCVKSSNANENQPSAAAGANRLRKPKPWRHGDVTISWSELHDMRTLFWRNAPRAYGGRPKIWEALEEAAACDLRRAQQIININSITLVNSDMTVCLDDTGNRYELPLYLLSEPINMDRGRRNIIDSIRRRI